MKKIIISSCILSFITIVPFFYYEILEVNSDNWIFLPFLFISLSLLYLFFGGLIGILFFNVDIFPDIRDDEEDYNKSKYLGSYYGKSHKKSRRKSSNDSSNDYLIHYYAMSSLDTSDNNSCE